MSRNGLIDGECKTLEYIAKEFGMTKERIRQICEKINEKLKESGVVDETDVNYD